MHPMSSTRDFDVVRDPLWNNIRLDRNAMAVLDTPASDTPALSALRASLAEVCGLTDLVADLLDTELDGATQAC